MRVTEEVATRGKPLVRNQTKARGRRGVVGGGTAERFDDVKQGDLDDAEDGVHVPSLRRGLWPGRRPVYEEPVVQESEHP